MSDILGAPVGDQIMHATFMPLLTGFIQKLESEGWTVEHREGATGHVVEFAKDQTSYTAHGENVLAVLQDLVRNMTQAGVLPKELLEMQRQIEAQVNPVRDAVREHLSEVVGNAVSEES